MEVRTDRYGRTTLKTQRLILCRTGFWKSHWSRDSILHPDAGELCITWKNMLVRFTMGGSPYWSVYSAGKRQNHGPICRGWHTAGACFCELSRKFHVRCLKVTFFSWLWGWKPMLKQSCLPLILGVVCQPKSQRKEEENTRPVENTPPVEDIIILRDIEEDSS